MIGGVLVHPHVFNLVAAVLQADDFHHPPLRSIYAAMVELERASRPIDILTVADQMKALDTFDKLRAFGGSDYFVELHLAHGEGACVPSADRLERNPVGPTVH